MADQAHLVAEVRRSLNEFFKHRGISRPQLDVSPGQARVKDSNTILAIRQYKRCVGWTGKDINADIGPAFLGSLGLTTPKFRATPVMVARGLKYRATLKLKYGRPKKISNEGVDLVAQFEGYGGRPYNDPVGYATVGYGHLIAYRNVNASDARRVWVKGQAHPGVLTRAEADTLLRNDLNANYTPHVLDTVKGSKVKVTQNMLDALVSFVYNEGVGALAGSTILRCMMAGDKTGAANAFLLWNKAGGQVLLGLTTRREAERRLFLS